MQKGGTSLLLRAKGTGELVEKGTKEAHEGASTEAHVKMERLATRKVALKLEKVLKKETRQSSKEVIFFAILRRR